MRGRRAPLHAFVCALRDSRALFVMIADKMRYDTLENCHRQALEYFQGFPQQIWYDNIKTVVIELTLYYSKFATTVYFKTSAQIFLAHALA